MVDAGLIAIDSLKIRIPLSKVTIVDMSAFGDKKVIDSDSGEIEREFKENRYKVFRNGISTSFGIERQVNGSQKVVEYLIVLMNSKLLKQRYFEGITTNTIELAYREIQLLNIAAFDYKSFLNAECTDVDYKQDHINTHFDQTIKIFNQYTRPSKKIGVGSNTFAKPDNKGIEFGKRETATPANPFLKSYHKGLELLNRSRSFYRDYLIGLSIDFNNLVRVETTVKNRKHFRKFGINDTSLSSLLSLSQDKLLEILKHSVNTHLEKRLVDTLDTPLKLTPMDRVQFNAMSILISQGMNYNLVRESLIQGIESSSQRSRTRKKLDTIYEGYIKGSKQDDMANEVSNFFNAVGWG